MFDIAVASPLVLCVLVVVVGAACSLFPFSPVEPWLLGVGAVAPGWLILPLVLLVTASSMVAKTLIFLGGRRVEASFRGKARERFEQLRARIADKPRLQCGTLFVSSLAGFPPFYLITAVCGTLRMPLRHFLILGGTGRGIRFAALLLAPQLFRPGVAEGQAPQTPPSIQVTGAGGETYVLINGLLGGVAGMGRLESRLVAAGHRVVRIDPYQLAIDSTVVSFDAMARIVDAHLERCGVRRAIVVAHSHGGGVALRLAANAPERAKALYLLDVGALPTQRGAVFGSAIRIVPIIARIPTGKGFIRHKIVAGLRENSASDGWLDEPTRVAYTRPLIDNVDRVVAMAIRLSQAEEPEPVSAVAARLKVPVTILRGAVRTAAGPSDNEFDAFGDRARIDTVAGTGHFPHEEAPDVVARLILRGRQLVALTKP